MNRMQPLLQRLSGITAWLCLIAVAGVAGCANAGPGLLVVEARPDLPPQLGTAPVAGRYALYIKGAAQPLVIYSLQLGERLGFEPIEGGTVGGMRVQYLEAVAGANLLRLEANQSYEWRRP